MCVGCYYVIEFGSVCLEYNGIYWYEECFKCVVCWEVIGISGFVLKDDEFYCFGCYQNLYVKCCVDCGELFFEGGVFYNEQIWYKECFSCFICYELLVF